MVDQKKGDGEPIFRPLDGPCPQPDGTPCDDTPITVTAVPPPPPPPTPDPPPTITIVAPPPSPPPTYQQVANYDRICTSANGSAVDIAKKIKGTSASGPPNPVTTADGKDWTEVEFDAYVKGNGQSFSAFNNAIYSSGSSSYASLPNPPSDLAGLIHNHPKRGGDQQQNVDKYPSDVASGGRDWESLQDIATRSGVSDPSLWILGPDGIVREFKLSEKAYYQGLSKSQLEQGVGLSGKERTNSC